MRLCACFGSQATGCARADSDVDVAIWPRKDVSLRDRLRWIAELENRLGAPVSLVMVTPNLNPVLGFEIVRDGRLAFEEAPGLWQHRRAQLWHAYNDALPFCRAAREKLRAFTRTAAEELAEVLEEAGGMHNVLAHLYERIDLGVLYDSIEPALDDFSEFVKQVAATTGD